MLSAFEANLSGWYFLTGPVAVVRDVIKRYGVFAAKNTNGFIDHNLVTSIVDARGTLRVQYLGMQFDVGEFLRDLVQLAAKSLIRLRRSVCNLVARAPVRVQTKLLAAFLAIVALLIVLGTVGLNVLGGANDRTTN